MNFKVEKKDFTLFVNVSTSMRKRDGKIDFCDTTRVKAWLAEKHPEYEIEKLVKAPKIVHNSLDVSRTTGQWIFELHNPEVKVVVKEEPVVVAQTTEEEAPLSFLEEEVEKETTVTKPRKTRKRRKQTKFSK